MTHLKITKFEWADYGGWAPIKFVRAILKTELIGFENIPAKQKQP